MQWNLESVSPVGSIADLNSLPRACVCVCVCVCVCCVCVCVCFGCCCCLFLAAHSSYLLNSFPLLSVLLLLVRFRPLSIHCTTSCQTLDLGSLVSWQRCQTWPSVCVWGGGRGALWEVVGACARHSVNGHNDLICMANYRPACRCG